MNEDFFLKFILVCGCIIGAALAAMSVVLLIRTIHVFWFLT